MMTTLIELRDMMKRIYAQKDVYIKPVLKFLLAFLCFTLMNGKIGFMQQLRSPLIMVVLALICALLPVNATVLIAGGLLIAHAYALSLETCAVSAAILAVMYLLYFRISPRMGVLLILAPICYSLKIPYLIALLGGLLFGPVAAVPAGCGAVLYHLMKYMNMNSTSLGTGEIEKGAVKMASLIDSLIGNKEMFLCAAAMVLTVLVVYFIRRLSIDYAWELAIGIGTAVNIVVHLTGALLPGVSVAVGELLIGSLAAAALAFAVKFFAFSVDYSRTERVQFEDDEYYYYVKAVPKNMIAESKKTVKKISGQKKPARTIKRIDS